MKSKALLHEKPTAEFLGSPIIIAYQLKDDGVIPNNPKLPLLLYQGALKLPCQDPASAIERLLKTNAWGGSWRNGIYPYHHYHSTAHEVLAVYRGSAKVQFGGERGTIQTIEVGDVVIIPAGVGHKRLAASGDFEIVGAYPAGQDWDMCYGKLEERPTVDRNIEKVPVPKTDPIYGPSGPLIERWLRT